MWQAASLTNGTKPDGSDADLKYEPPPNYRDGTGDPYFGGKELAKMAYIGVIANSSSLGMGVQALAVIDRLKPYVESWLTHKSGNKLVYDATWGSIVSCGCAYDDCQGKCTPHCTNGGPPHDCPALGDAGMDFGNAWFNDHHFHYGYHIYAAAVVAAFDPVWGATHLEAVLALIRDVTRVGLEPTRSQPCTLAPFPQCEIRTHAATALYT